MIGKEEEELTETEEVIRIKLEIFRFFFLAKTSPQLCHSWEHGL